MDRFVKTCSHLYGARPCRRQHQLAIRTSLILSILVVAITLMTPTLARDLEVPYKEYNSPQFRRLARRGEIALDRRVSPHEAAIQQRQDNADPFGGTAAPLATPTSGPVPSAAASSTNIDSTATIERTSVVTPTVTSTQNARVTAIASATSTQNATAGVETASPSTGASSPLPSPFDTSLGSNFTYPACPTFFKSFLDNPAFRDCRPTSLLLQNSNSFFKTSRSPALLSQALDASCGASLAQCSPLMASLATQLIQDSNCGQEYRNQNPLVTQAHAGLIAYEPLYRATCLKSSETENYCFADAISNTSNPSDSYPYYTVLGTNLPAASRPTCSKCLQDTMGIFAEYAVNKAQPVSETYVSTAQQIILGCGPEFVNALVPVATISNSAMKQSAITKISTLMAFIIGLLMACLTF